VDQGAVRCTRTNQVALSVPDPPTFAVATQAPHREVGSNYRLIVSLRAIPTGAVALRSIPLSCSGCPSHLGPCLPVIASSQATTLTSRPSSAVESVAVHRCDPMFRPWLPWASCSSSEGGGVPQSPDRARQAGSTRACWMELRDCPRAVSTGVVSTSSSRLGRPGLGVRSPWVPRDRSPRCPLAPSPSAVDRSRLHGSRCGCEAFGCRPASRRRDVFLHPNPLLHSTRFPAASNASPR